MKHHFLMFTIVIFQLFTFVTSIEIHERRAIKKSIQAL